MSTTKLFPINPSDLKHINLLDSFVNEEKGRTPIGIYRSEPISNNDINMELVLEEKEKVKDICHIQGYKDIKSCTISFAPKKKKNRKIVNMAVEYAMDTLGMEEVFLKINPEDNHMLSYLSQNEFECLGDEKGSIIYLKEKEC